MSRPPAIGSRRLVFRAQNRKMNAESDRKGGPRSRSLEAGEYGGRLENEPVAEQRQDDSGLRVERNMRAELEAATSARAETAPERIRFTPTHRVTSPPGQASELEKHAGAHAQHGGLAP